MRVYLQWAQENPRDWVALDVTQSRHVRNLPRKPVPSGTEPITDEPGWVNAINCQGIDFSGYDHVAIEPVGTSLRITGWQDDAEDFGDVRWATSWLLSRPAPDPALGGQMNTVQQRTTWATPEARAWFPDARPWTEFSPPPSNMTLHGVWLPDTLFAAHKARRTPHGWRDWIE